MDSYVWLVDLAALASALACGNQLSDLRTCCTGSRGSGRWGGRC